MSDSPTTWHVEVSREASQEGFSSSPLVRLRNEQRNPPRWRYLITYNDRGNIGRIPSDGWYQTERDALAAGEAKARALYGDPESARASQAKPRQAPPPSKRPLGFPLSRE